MSVNIDPVGLPVPAHLYDGYQVHRAALSRGFNVLCLPRQVLLAGRSSLVPAEISFTHGVPEASTVSAVTFAQDRRLRRALMERARLPIPKGATFTIRSVDQAGAWAKKIGFPVSVKEAVGENPSEAITGVMSKGAVADAIFRLRRRDPSDRSPGSNQKVAGYATTRLGYEIDEEGNQVATQRTRFLVEKQPVGESVRVFSCRGQDVQAVVLDPATGLGVRNVAGDLHPSLHEVAVRAVESVPGLAVGSVDLVVDDHTKPMSGQEVSIVEVSERIRSETYEAAAAGLGDLIGDALVRFQSSLAGAELMKPAPVVATRTRIEGVRDSKALSEGLTRAASDFTVAATVLGFDEVDGSVEATCEGAPSAVALFVESLMAGLLLGDRASCIEMKQIREDVR